MALSKCATVSTQSAAEDSWSVRFARTRNMPFLHPCRISNRSESSLVILPWNQNTVGDTNIDIAPVEVLLSVNQTQEGAS
eukprot:m.269035 g.269035  ORF g.269035 m.269035 type:complete len:80 (-) comp15664_c0_seq4:182-421(-)